MAHNFRIGINWTADGTGNTPLTDYVFVDSNHPAANDSNAGTDPNNPCLTIAGGVSAAIAASFNNVVLKSGYYFHNSGTATAITRRLWGDGAVTIDAGGTASILTQHNSTGINITYVNFTGFLITPSTPSASHRSFYFDGCTVDAGIFELGSFFAPGGALTFQNNTLRQQFNWNINSSSAVQQLRQNIHLADFYYTAGNAVINYHSNYFHSGTTYWTAARAAICSHNLFNPNVTINVDGTVKTLSAWQSENSYFPNCIEGDILFAGDPNKYQTRTVQAGSPAIRAGLSGINIGGVREGFAQNSSTTQWGVSPASAGITVFDASNSLQINRGTTPITSSRESTEIDLQEFVPALYVPYSGVADHVNHVANHSQEDHLLFEAQWAGKDRVYNGTWKVFRYSSAFPMSLDSSGKSNGEDGFDWGATGIGLPIGLRYVKIRTLIRN